MAKAVKTKARLAPNQIFAIGYSTRPIHAFIELLQAHDIKMVIDVRTIPKSHHCPEYNQLF